MQMLTKKCKKSSYEKLLLKSVTKRFQENEDLWILKVTSYKKETTNIRILKGLLLSWNIQMLNEIYHKILLITQAIIHIYFCKRLTREYFDSKPST